MIHSRTSRPKLISLGSEQGIWAASVHKNNQRSLVPLLHEGLETHYTADGVRVSLQKLLLPTYWYLIIAATINLANVIVIIYSYYRWWRIGRVVRYDPLEIAKVQLHRHTEGLQF